MNRRSFLTSLATLPILGALSSRLSATPTATPNPAKEFWTSVFQSASSLGDMERRGFLLSIRPEVWDEVREALPAEFHRVDGPNPNVGYFYVGDPKAEHPRFIIHHVGYKHSPHIAELISNCHAEGAIGATRTVFRWAALESHPHLEVAAYDRQRDRRPRRSGPSDTVVGTRRVPRGCEH